MTHTLFAPDLPKTETDVMAATQKPIVGSVFGASVNQAAWNTIPSWYLVTTEDRAINPFLSHPREVARLIEQAAGDVK